MLLGEKFGRQISALPVFAGGRTRYRFGCFATCFLSKNYFLGNL